MSRCSHIEMLASRKTTDVLIALKCFFARKGFPKLMISDREASFIRSGKELKRLNDTIDKSKLVSAVAPQGVQFKFNFSYSPNYQALVERLHKIVKDGLKTKMIRNKPTISEFHHHLCTMEHILNSRPLSTIRTSSTDAFQTVDAFQLFTGHPHNPIVPPYRTNQNYFIEQLKTAQHVAKHLKFMDIQLSKLWSFFYDSYFQALQKYTKKVDPTRKIKINDVVLIRDVNIRIRGEYPIGIVIGYGHSDATFAKDQTGYPRVLRVRIRKKGSNVEIVRPYQSFSLLEISEECVETEQK